MAKNNKEKKNGYPLSVRILALAMALLVASGIVTYLVTFIVNLFA